MTVDALINHVDENVNVNIYSTCDELVTYYDGRNSIDPFYNDMDVINWTVTNGSVDIIIDYSIYENEPEATTKKAIEYINDYLSDEDYPPVTLDDLEKNGGDVSILHSTFDDDNDVEHAVDITVNILSRRIEYSYDCGEKTAVFDYRRDPRQFLEEIKPCEDGQTWSLWYDVATEHYFNNLV